MALLDHAGQGAGPTSEIPSVAVSAEIRFAGEAQREAFLRELLATLRDLVDRHGSHGAGDVYRLVFAAHPDVSDEQAEASVPSDDERVLN